MKKAKLIIYLILMLKEHQEYVKRKNQFYENLGQVSDEIEESTYKLFMSLDIEILSSLGISQSKEQFNRLVNFQTDMENISLDRILSLCEIQDV